MALAYPHFIGSKKSTMVHSISSASSIVLVILTQDELKKIAAYKAIEYVESRIVLGLETGSTVKHAYCWKYVYQKFQNLFVEVGCVAKLRTKGESGEAFETDNKNYIVDLYLKKDIVDLTATSDSILRIVGIFEHRMFLDVATTVIFVGELGVTVKNKR
ncbi:hypothetical protein UlMin_017233 [Ulmus minor]